MKKGISVIIPALNEAENLKILIPHLLGGLQKMDGEILVCSANDCPKSEAICKENGVVFLKTAAASRAIQMNEGAKKAQFNMLYFVHADTLPPKSFANDIFDSYEKGFLSGCYRFKFNKDVLPLMINSFFTRFRPQMFRGGDQSLFVETAVFHKLMGYDESYRLMEEYPFIKKLKSSATFVVMPKSVVVSARKYTDNSYFRVNVVNLLVFILFHLRAPSSWLKKTYTTLLQIPST